MLFDAIIKVSKDAFKFGSVFFMLFLIVMSFTHSYILISAAGLIGFKLILGTLIIAVIGKIFFKLFAHKGV